MNTLGKVLAIPTTVGMTTLAFLVGDVITNDPKKIELCNAYEEALRKDLAENPPTMSLPSFQESETDVEIAMRTILSKEESPHWVKSKANRTCFPVYGAITNG